MPARPESFKAKWKPNPTKRVEYNKPEWQHKYNWTWHKARTAYLQDHPMCVMCEANGKLTPATVVDHIVPHKGDDTLFWDVGNWQSLCKRHHDRDKRRIENRYGRKLTFSTNPEWLKPIPTMTIVFGPPGSGKSTYVKQHARTSDTIIDLDEIISDITGKPIYAYSDDEISIGIRDRNRQLGELGKRPRPAWLILTGNGEDERQWWIDKLQPKEVVTMDASKDECIKRVQNDTRRPEGVKLRQIELIKEWK